LRDGWAKRTVFRLSERMKVRGEQLYVGGAVASGFTAALEYDRAAGCDPFFDFVRRKRQEFVFWGVEKIFVGSEDVRLKLVYSYQIPFKLH
jgi:hypothetical protein